MGWTKFWRKFGPKKKEKYLQDQKNPIYIHKDIDPDDPRAQDLKNPIYIHKDIDPDDPRAQVDLRHFKKDPDPRFKGMKKIRGESAGQIEKPKSNSSPDSLKKYDCDACLEECLSLDPFFAPTTPRWKTDDSWHLVSQAEQTADQKIVAEGTTTLASSTPHIKVMSLDKPETLGGPVAGPSMALAAGVGDKQVEQPRRKTFNDIWHLVLQQVLGSHRWAQEPEKDESGSTSSGLRVFPKGWNAPADEAAGPFDEFIAPAQPRRKTDDSLPSSWNIPAGMWQKISQQVLESQRIPLKLEQGWDQEPEKEERGSTSSGLRVFPKGWGALRKEPAGPFDEFIINPGKSWLDENPDAEQLPSSWDIGPAGGWLKLSQPEKDESPAWNIPAGMWQKISQAEQTADQKIVADGTTTLASVYILMKIRTGCKILQVQHILMHREVEDQEIIYELHNLKI
jgi:hypothetical protein